MIGALAAGFRAQFENRGIGGARMTGGAVAGQVTLIDRSPLSRVFDIGEGEL
jgi:hypothetical protein